MFSEVFPDRSVIFDDPKECDDHQVLDDLKAISNESIGFDDPKDFDDRQVFVIWKKFQMEVWTLIIYCETSIFEDLVTACGF